MDVVVFPIAPPMSQIQQLEGKECTVRRRSTEAARSRKR